jgi:hypothetical protein
VPLYRLHILYSLLAFDLISHHTKKFRQWFEKRTRVRTRVRTRGTRVLQVCERNPNLADMPSPTWAVAGCAVVVVAAAAAAAGVSDPVPCTAEETCYNTTDWRCVEAPPGVAGAACTLDYGFNTTGTCVCSDQGPFATCVNGTYPAPSPGAAAQLLVIGDSISMGYFGTLQQNLRCEEARASGPVSLASSPFACARMPPSRSIDQAM